MNIEITEIYGKVCVRKRAGNEEIQWERLKTSQKLVEDYSQAGG